MYTFSIFSLLSVALALLSAAQAPSSFKKAAIPIAARSPYLLTFLPTNASLPNGWSWETGYSSQIQSWAGLIRVDGETYAWAGPYHMSGLSAVHAPAPVGSGYSLTPTSSTLLYNAGPVKVTVTFLSPIEPRDWTRQSIPASYVAIEVQATDGASHAIQVYSDISAEWVSGDREQNVTWFTKLDSSGEIYYHGISILPDEQAPYQEINAQSAWGTIYYCTQSSGTSLRTGSDQDTRGQFVRNGTLDNSGDTQFRTITDAWPVFAFAQDLGSITSTSAPIVWAVANIRDSGAHGAVTYSDLSGQTQNRSLFYRQKYSDDSELLRDFLADYSAAFARSQELDTNITKAANETGGSDYAEILSLSTRQAYSGIEITIGQDASGNPNASDVMVFYKDTGIQDTGDGNAQVNPVDGLLSVFPTFLYLDAPLCQALLEPLLRFQNSSLYTKSYAAQNMGRKYPVAVANTQEHTEGIETSSGMIIMAYWHAKHTHEFSTIEAYYTLLQRWADYLAANTLDATGQTSADNVTRDGQANLALKGIIAVQAMSGIGVLLNDTAVEHSYASQAKALYAQWLPRAFSPDSGHMRLTYDSPESFSLGYNMFWDLALGSGLLNTSVIDGQVDYIANRILPYGVPTDSDSTSMISANWNMLAAAMATRDDATRQQIISVTNKLAYQAADPYQEQFPLIYMAQNGTIVTGRLSPRQGAAYALLFMSPSSSFGGRPASGNQRKSGASTIGGATVGAVVGASLIVGTILFWWRRRRSSVSRGIPAHPHDLSLSDAVLRSGSSGARAELNVTPFTVFRSEGIGAPQRTDRESETGAKRAYRLRRMPSRESLGRDDTQPSPALGMTPSQDESGVLHEISNLWREIFALRRDDAISAPPEYDG
ncbi:unnamed protein product [Peniophora sp. CBMAI 1063]|nr:unnamed protein product [Peniophora sp. CBMAI 1063]